LDFLHPAVQYDCINRCTKMQPSHRGVTYPDNMTVSSRSLGQKFWEITCHQNPLSHTIWWCLWWLLTAILIFVIIMHFFALYIRRNC